MRKVTPRNTSREKTEKVAVIVENIQITEILEAKFVYI